MQCHRRRDRLSERALAPTRARRARRHSQKTDGGIPQIISTPNGCLERLLHQQKIVLCQKKGICITTQRILRAYLARVSLISSKTATASARLPPPHHAAWAVCLCTVDVYSYRTIESIGKNFVTFVHKFFHIDSIGLPIRVTKFFHIDSIGTLQQCGVLPSLWHCQPDVNHFVQK